MYAVSGRKQWIFSVSLLANKEYFQFGIRVTMIVHVSVYTFVRIITLLREYEAIKYTAGQKGMKITQPVNKGNWLLWKVTNWSRLGLLRYNVTNQSFLCFKPYWLIRFYWRCNRLVTTLLNPFSTSSLNPLFSSLCNIVKPATYTNPELYHSPNPPCFF